MGIGGGGGDGVGAERWRDGEVGRREVVALGGWDEGGGSWGGGVSGGKAEGLVVVVCLGIDPF